MDQRYGYWLHLEKPVLSGLIPLFALEVHRPDDRVSQLTLSVIFPSLTILAEHLISSISRNIDTSSQ